MSLGQEPHNFLSRPNPGAPSHLHTPAAYLSAHSLLSLSRASYRQFGGGRPEITQTDPGN